MAIGYLTIQAKTAHDALPLGGILIRILDDRERSVYELITDENGETQTVPLETVDKSFSQNPYFSGPPYVSYNVLATAPGFNSLYVSQIPIYDGVRAVLPLSLIPMQVRQQSPMQAEIFVGSPAVSQSAPRSQEGNLSDTYLLRQVTIPNPITVHLGPPASSASNVQVSFPDYVKNAASSEIYPTWPEAALTANIYAIITFALNRVFTEWYRGRGYGFDITNSTAYDQSFVYGRPIYDTISRIVDNIFNQYVRRNGQNVPYFTSYCNGTTATCQGMSQWGTVTLAQNGLAPLEILRSYYPRDIEITQTNIISGTVSSYPGTPLREGSSGLDVQTVQKWLARIRKNYPAIPVITDQDGQFQGSTRAAVARFQSIFNLASDGIVGNATWYKLSQIYTAVARLAELDSEGVSTGIGTVPPSSVLRQGARGQDVVTLQYLLNVASEYYPGIPAPSQDGIFGNATKDAVTAFQQIVQLNPDGIVGPLTWQALYDVYLGIHQNVPSPSPGPNTTRYVVKAGDSLWLIAQKYGTTVEEIRNLNGLTSDMLSIGQVLIIPADAARPYIESPVKAGDSLWLIANRYHTTVDDIRRLNGLTSNLLNIGQVLRVPVG